MSTLISSLVHETTTTAGAGAQTVAAVNARRTFNVAFGTGGTNVFYYALLHRSVNEWEYGTGHLSSATVLVRDTVIASSNANTTVTFTAGTIDVINDLPAQFQISVADAAAAYHPLTTVGIGNDNLLTAKNTPANGEFARYTAAGIEGLTEAEFKSAANLEANTDFYAPGGTDVPVADGGTGASTLTGLLQGNGTSAITGVTNSSTVGQVLRVTGASAYAWGAVDLADTDAVTGTLPAGNHPAASDTASGIVELATTTEALTGTDAARAVTPDALAALWEKGSNVASAGTVSFGEGGFFHVTGTTTITDIDFSTAKDGRAAWVIFDGALTLTHNATTLVLPTGANIVTAAGDRALFVQDASDNVYCMSYQRASGDALAGGLSDPELTSIAGLTSAANKFPYYTGSGTAALADLSLAMRMFLTTSDSANLRGVLTDETGTGLAYFQGGALGTPSSGTLSSCSGYPSTFGLQVFTGSGTYTPTSGMKYCLVISTGGGGGGGGADNTDAVATAAGGGGGAAGTCIEVFSAATIGASQTVTIGGGGSGGSTGGGDGSAGSNTTFGALHTANGGGLGGGAVTGTATFNDGGAGGVPTGGALNVTGGEGISGKLFWYSPSSDTWCVGGDGGASYWGGGGHGGLPPSGTSSDPGTAGAAYGSGGGGAACFNTITGSGGGNGAGGCVMVLEII